MDNRYYYPLFRIGHFDSKYVKNYVSEILTPFPTFKGNTNSVVTDFSNLFTNCNRLSVVPSDLFKNNTEVTTFFYAFAQSGVETLPTGLFKYNTKVLTFEGLFNSCALLSSIPEDLFQTNLSVNNMHLCFYNCNQLPIFNIIIGSSNVVNANDFVTAHWQSTVDNRIVRVPADSTTYNTFIGTEFPGKLGVQTY